MPSSSGEDPSFKFSAEDVRNAITMMTGGISAVMSATQKTASEVQNLGSKLETTMTTVENSLGSNQLDEVHKKMDSLSIKMDRLSVKTNAQHEHTMSALGALTRQMEAALQLPGERTHDGA